MRIREKTDKQWFIYKLWFNDHVPQHCYLRHLLVWLHCTKIEWGVIFPSKFALDKHIQSTYTPEELNTVDGDGGHPVESIPYTHFSKFLKLMQRQIPDALDMADWGPHSARTTFYLHSVLGGAPFASCMRNARHHDLNTAFRYWKDACHILQAVSLDPSARKRQNVSPFQDLLIHGAGSTAARVSRQNCRRLSVTKMKDVCLIFVEKMLGVPKENQHYRDPRFLLERSYDCTLGRSHPKNDFMEFCDMLPPDIRNTVQARFNIYLNTAGKEKCPSCEGPHKMTQKNHQSDKDQTPPPQTNQNSGEVSSEQRVPPPNALGVLQQASNLGAVAQRAVLLLLCIIIRALVLILVSTGTFCLTQTQQMLQRMLQCH